MKILVTGVNHKTAPIEVREKLVFSGDKLQKGLDQLLLNPAIEGGIILSTCNRIEIYIDIKETEEKIKEYIKRFLSEFHSIDKNLLDTSLYFYSDADAIRHIFRVTSSLDSMVIGEPQILGQVKDAFEFALSRKTTSVILNKLMRKAISVAKRIRRETRIGKNAVSISYAAVELAKKIFIDLNKKTFMLLGAGEMAELTLKHLINNTVGEILIVNRTYQRALQMAKKFSGKAVPFEVFKEKLSDVDIVICSTTAPRYILQKSEMKEIMKKRKYKAVFMIDISVPRNIDPKINDIVNVYLYDIDDLQSVVDANMLKRKAEAEKAEKILQEEVEKFQNWIESLTVVPTIVALKNKVEEIKNTEFNRLINKMQGLTEKEKQMIEYAMTGLVNKLIHPPLVALREESKDREFLIATIRKLYGLDENKNDEI